MLSKKQQLLIEEIERGGFDVVVRAAVQIISDLQIGGLTVDDYSESFAGISQYFDAVESAFLRLAQAEISAETLFYQLFYVARPLHRAFLLGMFGAALFKGAQETAFLFEAVKYAVQVTDPLQGLFLRYYIQQQLQYYLVLQPTDIPADARERVAVYEKDVSAAMQANFICALRLYQQLLKASPQAQAQNFAFLPVSFLNGLGSGAAGPLLQAGLGAECPYFQLEALRFIVQKLPMEVQKERFPQMVQLFTRPLRFSRLEYQTKLLLVCFLGQLCSCHDPALILYEFVELVDGVLGLDQVLDAFQKLIQQKKSESFTLQVTQKTFSRLFTRFRTGQYQEYYLLHQFIQQIMATLTTPRAYKIIVTELSYVFAFLMAQANPQQAGRVATRVISELGKRDNVQLEFRQVIQLAQQIQQTVQKDEFQYPDTVFNLAVLAASSEFEVVFCLLSNEVVAVLNGLESPRLTQTVLYRLTAAPLEDQHTEMRQIRDFYLSVCGSLEENQKTAFVTDASIRLRSLAWADLLPQTTQALSFLAGAVCSQGFPELHNELLCHITSLVDIQEGPMSSPQDQVEILLILLETKSALASLEEGGPKPEVVKQLFQDAETLIAAADSGVSQHRQIEIILEAGWALKRFYNCEGNPGFSFFTNVVYKARRLIDRGALEDKEEKRRAFALAAAIEAQ